MADRKVLFYPALRIAKTLAPIKKMKSTLLTSCLVLITTFCLSQTEVRGEKDFFITYQSTNGNDIVIKVVDNTKFTIPTAFILVGDQTTLTRELRDCEHWSGLNNRTYIIDKNLNEGIEIQEAVNQILSSQKLLDSKLYLIQANSEFEQIETKPGNIKGGTIIQLVGDDLCRTIKK